MKISIPTKPHHLACDNTDFDQHDLIMVMENIVRDLGIIWDI